ncbi:MAG: heme exporter protein CcmD [Hyphomicrobiaceae bacterium]
MDLGPHATFIWLCYAIVGVVIAALVGFLAAEGARLKRELADLEAQGVMRERAGKDDKDRA